MKWVGFNSMDSIVLALDSLSINTTFGNPYEIYFIAQLSIHVITCHIQNQRQTQRTNTKIVSNISSFNLQKQHAIPTGIIIFVQKTFNYILLTHPPSVVVVFLTPSIDSYYSKPSSEKCLIIFNILKYLKKTSFTLLSLHNCSKLTIQVSSTLFWSCLLSSFPH